MDCRFRRLPTSFYERSAEVVAEDLLGRFIVRQIGDWQGVLRIVETEAYLGARDRASHAWDGRKTRRNASLYLQAGHAYVYLIYGIHHCLNAVTKHSQEGEEGSAVLIRAAEVLEGEAEIYQRRGLKGMPKGGDLAGGPGKICQALAVDLNDDGRSLDHEPLFFSEGESVTRDKVARGPRIGIAYAEEAVHWPLRFAIKGNREVSRPRLL